MLGFGRKISWTDDMKLPPGHQLTFKDALHTMSTDIFLKLIVPGWAMGLTKHLRHVRQAFIEMDVSYTIWLLKRFFLTAIISNT